METTLQPEEPIVTATPDLTTTASQTQTSFASFLDDEPEEYVLASKGIRFVGYLIDLLGMVSVGFIIGVALALMEKDYLLEQINDRILGLIMLFVYYLLTEGVFNQTLGKIITRTKVVTEDGLEPEFPQILKRTLCRIIPFDAFSFLTSETGMHDRISKTLVVKIPRVD